MPAACGRCPPRSPVRRVVPVSVGSCRFDATSGWRTSPPSPSGGPIDRLVEVTDADRTRRRGPRGRRGRPPLLLLGGGSNVVAPDEGWPGDVVVVRSRGIERDGPTLTVQAGEPWDDLVAYTVENGLAGVEALSGIPGSTGATPVQNVGAYGQEVAADDHRRPGLRPAEKAERTLTPAECGFAYRDSRLKRDPGRFVVLDVTFALDRARGVPPGRLRRAGADARRRDGGDGAAGRRPVGGPRAAPRQGHGARPGRSRQPQRRVLLHQPDRAGGAGGRRLPELAGRRRSGQAQRRLAGPVRRLRPRHAGEGNVGTSSPPQPRADDGTRRDRPPSCSVRRPGRRGGPRAVRGHPSPEPTAVRRLDPRGATLCWAAWASGRTTIRSMFTWCGRVTAQPMQSAMSSATSGSRTPR